MLENEVRSWQQYIWRVLTEMSADPLVFVMQDSGTASGFRITNRSTTGFHIKANGVYTFGIKYLAIYLGFNTNGV